MILDTEHDVDLVIDQIERTEDSKERELLIEELITNLENDMSESYEYKGLNRGIEQTILTKTSMFVSICCLIGGYSLLNSGNELGAYLLSVLVICWFFDSRKMSRHEKISEQCIEVGKYYQDSLWKVRRKFLYNSIGR